MRRGFGTFMRAVRVHQFGGPEVLKLEEGVPVPQLSSDNELLIRVMSAGVNPVDTYIRQGTYSRKPDLPYIPGSDAAGIVEKIGSKVTKFKPGDRVFCTRSPLSGTYAEFCVLKEDGTYPLLDSLTFSQGAAIGVPYFTAYRALFEKCNAKPFQTVLVHGASGAVGLAAVQMARAHGMTVFGTAGSPDGQKIVEQCGAHLVFNHKQQNYCSKIMEATGQEGVDLILEMLSNVNLGKDLGLLKKFGTVAIVGSRGPVEINPRLLMQKESSIVGVSLHTSNESDWLEMGAAIMAGITTGWLRPIIDKEYPLERAAHAHDDIINSSGAKGKLVLSLASQC